MPYGQNAGIAIAFQNSFGTVAAVGSLFQLPVLTEDVGLAQDELISQNLNGRFDEGDAYSGHREYGGPFEAEAQPLALGALISSVVNDPTSVTSGSLGTHTWNPRTGDWDGSAPNRPVSYYKYLVDGGSAQFFYDLVGSRLEILQSEGGFLTVRTNYMGGKTSAVASQALTLDSTPRWPWNTASLSLGGAGVNDFRNITITHDESLESRFTLDGTLTANRIKRNQARTIRVAGTLIFESQTELNLFKAETSQALILTFKSDKTEIQSGYNNQLTIDIPSFKWLEWKPSVQGPGEIEVNFRGKADYHAGSLSSIQYTLINTHAAYM